MKGFILVVEDDNQLNNMIQTHLTRAGYQVIGVNSGEAALEQLKTNSTIDVAVLDIDLSLAGGELDGLDVARAIYYQTDAISIMLTAFAYHEYGDQSYALGAKSYIQKSDYDFMPRLKNNIAALLDLKNSQATSNLSCGGLTVYLYNHRVIEDGELIDISPMEVKLLVTLIKNCQQAISKEDLHLALYPNPNPDTNPSLSIVETYISSLRKKLKVSSIETVRGFGYRLNTDL